MFLNIWKQYRDFRYQNPVIVEQARSLNYKFIKYQDYLINREYEEEFLTFLISPNHYNAEIIKNSIEELELDLTMTKVGNVLQRDTLSCTTSAQQRKLVSSKIVGAIFDENHCEYTTSTDDKIIESLINSQKLIISNKHHEKFYKFLDAKTILSLKGIDCLFIRETEIDNYKNGIKDWSNIYII